MAFRADFELDTGNNGSIRINCHCPLIRRSSSCEALSVLEESSESF